MERGPRQPSPSPLEWVWRFLTFEVLVARWAIRLLFALFLLTGLLAVFEGNPYSGNPYARTPSLLRSLLQALFSPPLSIIIGLLVLRVAMEAVFVLFRISDQLGKLGEKAPAVSAPAPQSVSPPQPLVTGPRLSIQLQLLSGRLVVVLVLITAALLLLFPSNGVTGVRTGRLLDVGPLGFVALILFGTGCAVVLMTASPAEGRAKIPGVAFGGLLLSLGLSVFTLFQRMGGSSGTEWGLPWYGYIVALGVATYLAFEEWFGQRTAPPPVSGTDSTGSSSSDPQ